MPTLLYARSAFLFVRYKSKSHLYHLNSLNPSICTPAAEYCRAYSKGYKDVGSWYLPAAGELNEIVLNKDAINTILTKLGKNSLSKNSYTWSSSQYTSSNAWYHNWSGSNWYNNTKYTNRGVRPICAF